MPWNLDGQTATVGLPPSPYSLDVTWTGRETTTGTLVGIEVRYDAATGAPYSYWYAQQPNVTLLSLQTLDGPSLNLTPVEGANTQGTIQTPPAYAIGAKYLALSLEKSVFFPIFTDSSLTSDFKYIAPNIHNASSQVCAWALSSVAPFNGSTSNTCIDALAPQTDDAQLEILASPQPFAPANGANSVDMGTTLAWSPFKGKGPAEAIHSVQILPSDPANPTYFIFTAGTNTTVPDLSPVGLAFGRGDYTWLVFGYAPFATMDEFTEGIPAPTPFPTVQVPPPPVANASTGWGSACTFHHPSL